MNETIATNKINDTKNSFLQSYEDEAKEILLNTVLKSYDTEWQRTHDIESKASSTVGFVGVILSLTIVTFSSILVDLNNTTRDKIIFGSIYPPILIVIILSLMVLSIYFGMHALSVKGWWFLYADKYYDSCKTTTKSKDIILEELLDEFVHGIQTNNILNDKIALDVKRSHKLFLLSIVIIVLSYIVLLNQFY